MRKRIIVVGGVAAGASAAAKARRLNEDVEIVLIEAGPYISFANCGLPYYIGGEIAERNRLFVTTPKLFADRFDVEVRLKTHVVAIDRERQVVTVGLPDGASEEIKYDRLVLATGTLGVVPPIDGLHRRNIFTVRTVPDVDAIMAYLAEICPSESETVAAEVARECRLRAVIIGGGYIGLETAEQLLRRGLKVTVVELMDQLMLAVDPEVAEPLRVGLVKTGCEVILGDGVGRIVEKNGETVAVTASGRELPFDLGILAVGVKPNVELAMAAGIALGETGAIQVDQFQRTSDPAIFAAGDNCEALHLVLNRPVNIPLAGPANKAGRVAGANAAMDLAGRAKDDPRRLRFRGVLGTAIVRVCDTVVGVTGLTESQAHLEGVEADIMYMIALSHAGYYPGAEQMLLKLLYSPKDGRLLGAQIVGGSGVDKRIDVLSTAIMGGMAVEDLEQLDLCYAPPFGSARDLVVLAGFAAANARRGQAPTITPAEMFAEIAGENPPVLIDTRSAREYALGHLEGAVNIPVVASGGCGTLEHIYEVLTKGKADAALAASIFHYREISIKEVKEFLKDRGVAVRL